MINRDPAPDSGYWDYPVTRVKAPEADLRMVRLFDFDVLGFRDFRYYMVRIRSAIDSSLVGRAALIDCEYVTVHLDEEELTHVAEGSKVCGPSRLGGGDV